MNMDDPMRTLSELVGSEMDGPFSNNMRHLLFNSSGGPINVCPENAGKRRELIQMLFGDICHRKKRRIDWFIVLVYE